MFASAVAVGGQHRCALQPNGNAFCWGGNSKGQLGVGNDKDRATPQKVAIPQGITGLALGDNELAAVHSGGKLYGSGDNDINWTGNATSPPSLTAPIQLGHGPMVQLAFSDMALCGRLANGTIACAGDNKRLQLGAGPSFTGQTSVKALTVKLGDGEAAAWLEGGDGHFCARLTTGVAACWGRNDRGQVTGKSKGNAIATPVHVKLTGKVATVGLGGRHSCAVVGGEVACWGDNAYGQVSATPVLTNTTYDTPIVVQGLVGMQRVTGGANHTCALKQGGDVWCWGRGDSGQLGYGKAENSGKNAPVRALLPGPAKDVRCGPTSDGCCALLTDGSVYCWGANKKGELGVGITSVTPAPAPQRVLGSL